MTVLCIFHRLDFDGHGSASIVYRYYSKDSSVIFLPYNYENDIEIPKKKFDEVICVDVTPKLKILKKLKQICGNILIIDHHNLDDKLIEDIKKLDIRLKLDKKYSAIYLTFKYFYPKRQVPMYVTLLEKYDSWKDQDKKYWEEFVLPFQYGCRSYETDIQTQEGKFFWLNYIQTNINKIISEGKIILKYHKQICKEIINNFSDIVDFEGYKTIVCNSSIRGSILFDSVSPRKYDIMICYVFDMKRKEYIYSIYSDKKNIDCSKIAKKYGGGGHKGAAGFSSKKNMFK